MTKLNLKQMEPRDVESEAPQRREGERGERNVALANIEKIAHALRVTLAKLFRGV